MFVPSHWARAFVNAIGDASYDSVAEEALELVKVMAPVILSVRGQAAGTAAARRLEALVRRVFAAVPGGNPRSRELALGLILLLVKKNLLKHAGLITGAIEQELDTRRGVLRGVLEYARDPGAEFLDQLTGTLVEKTGAAGVRLSTRVVPELLAGCRLRIGGGLIDASLQTRLRQLEAELAGGSPRAGPLMEVF